MSTYSRYRHGLLLVLLVAVCILYFFMVTLALVLLFPSILCLVCRWIPGAGLFCGPHVGFPKPGELSVGWSQ
jgi:hypothetical protein